MNWFVGTNLSSDFDFGQCSYYCGELWAPLFSKVTNRYKDYEIISLGGSGMNSDIRREITTFVCQKLCIKPDLLNQTVSKCFFFSYLDISEMSRVNTDISKTFSHWGMSTFFSFWELSLYTTTTSTVTYPLLNGSEHRYIFYSGSNDVL